MPFSGKVTWRLRDNYKILEEATMEVKVNPLSSSLVEILDFKDQLITKDDARKLYVEYLLETDDKVVSSGTVLFTRPKHFEFLNPKLSYDVSEDDNNFIVKVSSKNFTKYVEMDLKEANCVFEDNFFDIIGGVDKVLKVDKSSLSKKMNLEEFKNQFKLKSIFDIEN